MASPNVADRAGGGYERGRAPRQRGVAGDVLCPDLMDGD